MTVAAVLMVPNLEMAMADAHGEPAIRRAVQAAWSGGALPIVVVVPPEVDDVALAATLADLPVAFARPSPNTPRGVAWFVAGFDAATSAVSETAAALLWPVRHAWVDPETVTSLVEAHGAAPGSLLRPSFSGRAGFPTLVPLALRARLEGATGSGEDAIARLTAEGPAGTVELGDPGIVHDLSTRWDDLPAFHGPDHPAAEHATTQPEP